jgi:hypothetical protein
MELFEHQKKAIELLKSCTNKDGRVVVQVDSNANARSVFGSQVPFPIALKKAMITMPQQDDISGWNNDRIVDATFLIQRTEPLPTDELSVVIAKPRSNIEAAELKVFVDFTAPFFLGETDEKS